jgi:ankyrin repeat protein
LQLVANVHAKDKQGLTALHFAAKSHEQTIDSMSVLIDAGVDVNESDGVGNSAGHLAVLARCIENLKFLLAHGAQVDKQNNAGETMLFMAAEARRVEIVDVLIEAGADSNVRMAGKLRDV